MLFRKKSEFFILFFILSGKEALFSLRLRRTER